MWYKDYELIKELHDEYSLQGPLLDAGGLKNPCIANYEISKSKAYKITTLLGNKNREVVVPHEDQRDRYENIQMPWKFIDSKYTILNPEYGDPPIEDLPKTFKEAFNTVILVSVFEHVVDPFICSDALFEIIKPGGHLINCVPFMFPIHDERDNWRYSPQALKYIHEKSGFRHIKGNFHINYSTKDGIGDYHDADKHQAVIGCYAFCQKP